jgi:hypothetical protein
VVRHFDAQLITLETQLQCLTKEIAGRDYALPQTVPGIGQHLGATILYEIGDSQPQSPRRTGLAFEWHLF